jgi:uncharacterized delta-60 repeat protein
MKRFLITACASLSLVACGGGGSTTPPATPGFTISLAPATATVIPGKSINTIVNAVRAGGFNDAINVTLAAQTGINAASLTIPAGGSSGALTLETTALLPQTSSPLALTLTGKSAALPDQTAVLSLTVRGASGAADTTFGTNGQVRGGTFDFPPQTARFQVDGKLVSINFTAEKNMQVHRFNADGSPDTGFGTAGSTVIEFPFAYGGNTAQIAFQPDGKIIVAGAIGATATRDIGLARLTANGTLDTSFDSDGTQVLDYGGADPEPAQIVVANNKILVVSTSSLKDFALARYTLNGTLDSSFDTDGKLVVDFGGNDFASAAVVQSDGKIVVTGINVSGASPNFNYFFGSARVNDNGTLDSSFDTDGRQSTYVTTSSLAVPAEARLTDMTITSDGKILMFGGATDLVTRAYKFMVVRLLPNGQSDTTFASSGSLSVGGGAGDFSVRLLSLPDGRIQLVGRSYSASSSVYLVRLNLNGTLDTTFGDAGKSYVPATFSGIFDATLLADGKIQVLSHSSDSETGQSNLNVTRYWP